MIVRTAENLNRKSYSFFIGAGELLLAFMLYFFPDWSKIFLFVLPLVLFFGIGGFLCYKYFKKNGSILALAGGIILLICGVAAAMAGRKTFMLGVAVLMFFQMLRFFQIGNKCSGFKLEKLIYFAGALLALVWLALILFKGLHLYWSVREYLAMYFAGSAFLSVLRKR